MYIQTNNAGATIIQYFIHFSLSFLFLKRCSKRIEEFIIRTTGYKAVNKNADPIRNFGRMWNRVTILGKRKGERESGRIWTWNKVKARRECGYKGGERKKNEENLGENRGWERPERELSLSSDARSASTGGYMEMLVKYIIPAWQCNSLICLAPPAATLKPCIQIQGADGNGVDWRPKRPIEDLQTRCCYCYRLSPTYHPFQNHLSLHFRSTSLWSCSIQTTSPTGWRTAL